MASFFDQSNTRQPTTNKKNTGTDDPNKTFVTLYEIDGKNGPFFKGRKNGQDFYLNNSGKKNDKGQVMLYLHIEPTPEDTRVK